MTPPRGESLKELTNRLRQLTKCTCGEEFRDAYRWVAAEEIERLWEIEDECRNWNKIADMFFMAETVEELMLAKQEYQRIKNG